MQPEDREPPKPLVRLALSGRNFLLTPFPDRATFCSVTACSMKAALSELEHDVMNVIWKRGKVTASDVQEALGPKKPLKDSTIRTILTRLERKGYVRHSMEGRAFSYSGVEQPGSVAARAVRQILDRFCHGSVESLLVGMVDDEIVDPAELEQIAARLARENKARPLKKKRQKR